MSPLENKDWLYQEYVTKDRSCAAIATDLGTYRHKVRRALIKMGIALKDQTAAQQAALKSGRRQHPTEGTQRSECVRLKISEGVADSWSNASDEQLQLRSDKAKAQWESMSEEERSKFTAAATAAILKAAKEGSKLEKFLRQELTNAGFVIEYHKEDFPTGKLHIDLFLPKLSTAIEVDGPSHFLPIWGDAQLLKTIESDEKKIGLLLSMGLVIVRIRCTRKTLSQKVKRDILALVIEQLNNIINHFPGKTQRLIDIEV